MPLTEDRGKDGEESGADTGACASLNIAIPVTEGQRRQRTNGDKGRGKTSKGRKTVLAIGSVSLQEANIPKSSKNFLLGRIKGKGLGEEGLKQIL